MNYAIYIEATGEITGIYTGPADTAADQCGPGESCIADPAGTARDDTHRINGASIVQRAPLPAAVDSLAIIADGVDECVISGIPAPADFAVRGPVGSPDASTWGGMIEDGELRVSVEAPGVYHVRIVCFPYLSAEYLIDAS